MNKKSWRRIKCECIYLGIFEQRGHQEVLGLLAVRARYALNQLNRHHDIKK